MAHFAQLDENNIVQQVIVVANESCGEADFPYSEFPGQEFISTLGFSGIWKQTSYNTRGGIHYDPETNEPSLNQTKAFRKNYAGIGYYYDEENDAFIPPSSFSSWVLNSVSLREDLINTTIQNDEIIPKQKEQNSI
jgi:hypothetical protein